MTLDPLDEMDRIHRVGPYREPAAVVEKDDEAAAEVGALGEVDLAPVVRGERAPETPTLLRRSDGAALVYSAKITVFHGEPGFGKSLLALHVAAEVLNDGGRVAILDYEGCADTLVERLRALGVADDVIEDRTRIRYFNPPCLDDRRLKRLVKRVAGVNLVIIDAAGPAMTRQGLDENSNRDAALWHEQLLRPLALTGAAVIVVDHVVKDAANRGRGPRGAGAKLQLVDASYSVRAAKAFSRERAGMFRLVCEKDRFGHHTRGTTVAEVHVTPGDGTIAVEVEPATGTATVTDTFRPTGLMEKLSRALEARTARADAGTDDLPNRDDTLGLVKGNAKWKRSALELLVAGEFVARERQGRHVRHRSIRPYREADDDGPDEHPESDK